MQTNTRSNAPSAGQNLEENNPGNEPQKRFLPQRNPQPPPQEGWRRGDPTRQSPVEPIKALAFNTLLSSQETDTHRAETRSHGPRPRGDSFFTLPEPLGMSISSFSGSAVPMPLARRLPGGETISSESARLSKSAVPDPPRHAGHGVAVSDGWVVVPLAAGRRGRASCIRWGRGDNLRGRRGPVKPTGRGRGTEHDSGMVGTCSAW